MTMTMTRRLHSSFPAPPPAATPFLAPPPASTPTAPPSSPYPTKTKRKPTPPPVVSSTQVRLWITFIPCLLCLYVSLVVVIRHPLITMNTRFHVNDTTEVQETGSPLLIAALRFERRLYVEGDNEFFLTIMLKPQTLTSVVLEHSPQSIDRILSQVGPI
ncbi:hypothetical protein OPV22_015318 [Ensete ventricosum]|uniref:GPI-GlcNAc transferase complex PIG-H component conserved domain-containing protein n=1 Tax=Ensete ventricosum TaxID=4639 RepID=A0AAV8QZV1_ENSVE|nr:hypothetical protein OPV22_015318 [Ensete ventricosum]